MGTPIAPAKLPVVLQSKFGSWLSWSQPFIHQLVTGLDSHVRNIVLCHRTENLDRFPAQEICRVPMSYLTQARGAVAAAVHLQRNYSPDLIHAHFGWSGLRVLYLKQMLRIPLVVTFGGRDLGVQSQLKDFSGLYGALFGAADCVICVSQELADRAAAAGIPQSKIRTVYRGTDLSRFAPVDRTSRSAETPLNLLMIGRLTAKKGHPDALRALRRLVDDDLDLRLTIVGEGEAGRALKREVRRLRLGAIVRFAGSTDHAGVLRHISDADLLLHPSITPPNGDVEGIPNVVVEAQATGLPVVATRHGGIPEVVSDGESGVLVGEGDPDALADAIRSLAFDPGRRARFAEAARNRMVRLFDFGRQIEAHIDIYESLIERARSDRDWRNRACLPDDMTKISRPLSGLSSHPEEFSLGELAQELNRELRRRSPFLTSGSSISWEHSGSAEPTRFERIYERKSMIPTAVKYPIKRVAGAALVSAIRSLAKGPQGEPPMRGEVLDRRILDYFRNGGQLPEWEGNPEQAAVQILAEFSGA